MLGHKLWLGLQDRFDVFATVRGEPSSYERFGLFDCDRLMGGVEARQMDDILRALAWARPDVVINCIGVVKQVKQAEDPILCLELNSLFPHRLAQACRACGARLIQISTDCVFSGKVGHCSEYSPCDPQDLYGRTKLLGEVGLEGTLTIRTSLIGRELGSQKGLLEWFLAQDGKECKGYEKAIFTGLTTIAFSKLLAEVIDSHRQLSGVYHVSSAPISKYNLLNLIKDIYGLDIDIRRDSDVACDRSLDSSRFRSAINWLPEPWDNMIQAMYDDPTLYTERSHALVAALRP